MRRATPAISAFVCAALAARAAAAADLPRLDRDRPIHCMTDPAGRPVRVQCDDRRTCLVAPDRADDGSELRRTETCQHEGAGAWAALVKGGARMVPAVAESQPGYARSDAGRAYQVAFDMLDRVYFGAAWTPTFQRPDARLAAAPGFPLGRGRVETGFTASVLSRSGRSRHDVHVLEATASFPDFHLQAQLLTYDYQHLHRRPNFWLTSFFGPPRLHPGRLPLGWGFRVLGVEDRPPSYRRALDLELSEVHLAFSPWQSSDMYSHLRIEAGGDFGRHLEERANGFGSGVWYAGPTGAVRSRLALGQGGLHFLFVDLDVRRPVATHGETAGRSLMRLDATFAYEGVILALNDQPISVRLAATGSSREDPATQTRSVELGATAGLRFSLWAPPRVFEPLPELEDP